MLDTSFLIDFFKGAKGTKSVVKDEFAVSAITYHEIMTGVKRKKAKKEERFFKGFFSLIRILEYDVQAAEESSDIASKLGALGKEVNALDLLIAGIAVANGMTKIATRDKDFLEIAKVSDFQVLQY